MEGDKEKESDKAEQDVEAEEEDSSITESNALSPILSRKTGHKYALRQREGKKFLNTLDTPLVLTPSPPACPLHTSP